jgi:DNA-3-methyladenine glycosylase II
MRGVLREINGNFSTIFHIHIEPPFDFERSAGMHGRFERSLPDLYEDGVYKRVLHVSGKPVLVLISPAGSVGRPFLRVEARPRLSASEAKSLKQAIAVMFAPSFEYKRFLRVAKKDRVMNAITIQLRGLRPIPPPSVFEALVIAITEQQISLSAAMAIRSRLIEKYGDQVRFKGRTFFAFPTAASLAKANQTELRKVGLSGSKALCICRLAKGVASGELNLDTLKKEDDETAVGELTKIKGVGPWTAEYVLIRGMGRVNSLPADDLGIQRAVSQAYFKNRRVGSEDVRRILRKFAPFSGIAAFYIMYYMFWMTQDSD